MPFGVSSVSAEVLLEWRASSLPVNRASLPGGKGISKAPDETYREVIDATVVEVLFKTGRQDAPLTGRQRCPPLRTGQSQHAFIRKNSRTALGLARIFPTHAPNLAHQLVAKRLGFLHRITADMLQLSEFPGDQSMTPSREKPRWEASPF